ncbi:MAG TPA: DUF1549 domain-containing protein, partial [Pirellulales bacterium]|nr:DUF1549 domain-containing protein [Pirellulales bacterium]
MPGCLDRHRTPFVLLAALLLLGSAEAAASRAAEPDELWAERVEPILQRHCTKCHGGVRQQAGLDVRSLENLLRGGEQNAAIEPGDLQNSLVYLYIQPDFDPHMPPADSSGGVKQLLPDEIATIGEWITALPKVAELTPGADRADPNWPERYAAALRSKRQPRWTPPADASLSAAIDGFIRDEWQRRGIQPAPRSDDRTFVRRVYLDLAGRIPTLAEAEAFVESSSPEKRAELVDRLLASAEYARQMSEVFDLVLLERKGPGAEDRRRDQGWYAYLERAF